jgi:cell shape-determining protein MreC
MMYILLAIVLMSMDQRGQYVPRIRNAMELAFEPVFAVIGWPSSAMRSIGENTRASRDLIAEKKQLN